MHRAMILLVAGGALTLVIGLAAPSVLKEPPKRSPEFMIQAKVTFDAIERSQGASGAAFSLAMLEAKRELDNLDRLADTPIEHNTAQVFRNYFLQLRVYDGKPQSAKQVGKAYGDVLAVLY